MNKMLRPAHALVAISLGALLSAGCLAPSGETVAEKRASALEMRDTALAALYEDFGYRILDYEFEDGSDELDLAFEGLMYGVEFRF